MSTLLVSQAVALASVTKALIAFALVLGWARWAMTVDQDANFFHLNRRMWNTAQVAAGALAFAALFLVPYFVLGLIAAVIILGGAAGAYIAQHNRIAPKGSKWTFDLEGIQTALMKRREEKAAKNATLRFTSNKKMKGVPAFDDPNHEPHVMFEELIEQALRRGAQRLELLGSETGFTTQLIIDNHAYRQGSMPPSDTVTMLDYVKAQCKMDTEERRKKQVGHCKIESQEFGEHELRVMTAGSTRGLNCNIIIDPNVQLTWEYKDLGLLDAQREKLKPVIESTGKVVLIAAPPGHGRTSTMYTIAHEHDPYVLDIHFFEPMAERELEGVSMHEMPPEKIPGELQSLLLRDPQVVAIPSVQSPDLAKLIAGAGAEEGPRFYAGIKGDDTFGALKMWTKAVGDPELVARGTSAVVAQRLLRKLCTVCRQKYQPDVAALRKLNLPPDRIQNLYKASGKVRVKNDLEPCPACHGLGYRGLTAAFEVMVFDDEARELYASGKMDAFRTHLRRQKMMWLQEAALAKVVSGVTSISEVTQSIAKEETGVPA